MSTPYTDDEIVAAAYLCGTEWRRPLMTVEVADADQLAAAIARGLRSFALRGLLDEGGMLTQSAHGLGAAISAVPRLIGTWVDESFVPLPGYDRFELLEGADGQWFAASVSGHGVHRFTDAELTTALGFFADIAKMNTETADVPEFCIIGFDREARPTAGLGASPGLFRRLALPPRAGAVLGDELVPEELAWDIEVGALLGREASKGPLEGRKEVEVP